MKSEILQRLLALWQRSAGTVCTGASPDEIAAFEARVSVELPPALAAFYGTVNGVQDAEPDLFRVWPLDEVGFVREVVARYQGIPNYGQICAALPDADDYVAFADGMLWSHVLAVRIRPHRRDTQVVWLCGDAYAVIARTFEDFWSHYLVDPVRVVWARDADVVLARRPSRGDV